MPFLAASSLDPAMRVRGADHYVEAMTAASRSGMTDLTLLKRMMETIQEKLASLEGVPQPTRTSGRAKRKVKDTGDMAYREAA